MATEIKVEIPLFVFSLECRHDMGNQMDVVSAYLLRFGITINLMKFF
jgi:hypothetical protein